MRALFLTLAILGAHYSYAQSSSKEDDQSFERAQKYSQKASEEGVFLQDSGLLSHLKREMLFFNRASPNYNPDQDADRTLKKMQALEAALGGAGAQLKFHYFAVVATQEIPICWEVLNVFDKTGELFLEIKDSLLAQNPEASGCRVRKSNHQKLLFECFAPVVSYLIEDEEPEFKNKLVLFDRREKVETSKCNGFKKTVSEKKVFSPHIEQEFTKMKKAKVRKILLPEKQLIQLDLTPMMDSVQRRFEKKIKEELEEKLSAEQDELNKGLPPIGDEDGAPTVFGKPEEPSLAMIVDFSSSVDDVRDAALLSMKSTILSLKPTQFFTIGFITGWKEYFNDGTAVPATPENKEAAVQFIDSMKGRKAGGDEPFAEAFSLVKSKNPALKKIYIFTDGEFQKEEIASEWKVIPGLKVPIDVRAMGKSKEKVISGIARKSGGKVLDGEFSSSSLEEYTKRMEELKVYQKKVKEIKDQMAVNRKKAEEMMAQETAKKREKLKRLQDLLTGVNGVCPDRAALSEMNI